MVAGADSIDDIALLRRRDRQGLQSLLCALDPGIVPVFLHLRARPPVRGINALIRTVTTKDSAPVIAGARLRKGAANSARGAGKFVSELLATVARLRSAGAAGMVLVRADSAYYSHGMAAAAARAGARISVTVRMDPATLPEHRCGARVRIAD